MTAMNSYGMWHVTTEGDVEGRSTKDLGVHEGHLDDIAFALAGASCYKLTFELVDPNEWHSRAPRTEVCVALGVRSGTWDLNKNERANYFKQLLKGRDVTVEADDCYAAVNLIRGSDPLRREVARREALRSSARAKLTAEELAALGVKS